MVFDPAWDVAIGAQAQTPLPSPELLGVNGVDLVQVGAGSTQTSLLYLSCNRFNQILELDVSDFDATGFVPQKKLDLTVAAPNAVSATEPYQDFLYQVTTHYAPTAPLGGVDLLYVIGQQYMHVCERRPPVGAAPLYSSGSVPVYSVLHAQTPQFFNIDAGAVGQRMLEYSPLGQNGDTSAFGGREDYWTVCTDVDFPWTIFD